MSALRMVAGLCLLGIPRGATAGAAVAAPQPPEPKALREWAPALAPAGDRPVRMPSDLASQKIYVVGALPAPADVRTAVAHLLGYDWREGAATAPHSWLLYASADRMRLPERLRAQAIKEDRQKIQDRLMALREIMSGKAGAAERLAARFPEDAERFASAKEGDKLRLIGTPSATQAGALLGAGAWISPQLRAGGGPLADAAQRAFPMRQFAMSTDSDGRVRTFVYDPYVLPRPDLHLALDLWGDPGDQGVRGGMVDFSPWEGPPPRHPPGVQQLLTRETKRDIPPQFVLPPAPLAARDTGAGDPRLRKPVTLPDALRSPRVSYPQVLAAFAKLSGLTVLSDFYASTRLDSLDSSTLRREMRLDEMLDSAARAFRYTWRLDGNVILLRHAHWFFEEQREVPEAVLARLDQAIAPEHRLTLEQQVALAGTLTREQFENLAAYYADFRYVRHRYCSLRLFGSLTPRQREVAFSDSGLPYAALSPAQQELFNRVTRTSRPYYFADESGAIRRNWVLYLRDEQKSDDERDLETSIYYGWLGTDGTGCVLPAFVTVEPRTPFDTVRPVPPEQWQWGRGSHSATRCA